jgi:gluconolactonase
MPGISRRAVIASGALFPIAARAAAAPYGAVRRLDPALDALVAPDAAVEEIAHGITWAEGPVWVKNGDYLLFSDPPMNTIYRWSRAAGQSAFMHPSGYAGTDLAPFREAGSNGLAIDAAGALIMADSGNRALSRVDLKTKHKTIVVDRFEGKRFNSPNDLCIARNGAIYFTDPPYGLKGLENSTVKELPFSGVYHYAPDGKLALIDKTFLYPNGVALSPDEKTLYVSNTDAKLPIVRAYKLGNDGLPTSSSTFFDMKPLIAPGTKGMPDGMKIDAFGNLFAAGPGGMLVLSPNGKLLGMISVTGRATPNCAFGEDGHTLFVAATDTVARVRVKTHA